MLEKTIGVMFVCLGNICRSPAGEGILKKQAALLDPPRALHIESSGIGDWFAGRAPDKRMQEAASKRGYLLDSKAQQFKIEFFDQYDYVLAADTEVLTVLKRYAVHPEHSAKIHMMTDFSQHYKGEEVPDPYYLGTDAFEKVLDILEESCTGLLEHIVNARQNSFTSLS